MSQTPVKLNTKQEIQDLKCLLESLLPASIQVFNCVVLELLEDGVDRDIIINKGFTRDSINVVIFDNSETPRWKIIMFSNPEKNEDLRHLLENVLDFTQPLLFGGLTRYQQEVIKSFYGEKKSKWASECHIYMDWNENQAKVPASGDDPNGSVLDKTEENGSCKYRVARLSIEHAKLVDSNWKFQNSLSLKMLEGLIEQKKLLGLFLAGLAEPVAWITIYSYGSMGMLHTKEEFRRQGWAQFLVKAAKEYARSLGLVPYVHVEEDNLVSAGFFEKLGFLRDQYAVWTGYE